MAAYVEVDKIANEKAMLFVKLHIRSLINQLEIVKHFLINTGTDCMYLTETWLCEVIPNNLIGIDGYKLVRLDRPNTAQFTRGGGVCMFVKTLMRQNY